MKIETPENYLGLVAIDQNDFMLAQRKLERKKWDAFHPTVINSKTNYSSFSSTLLPCFFFLLLRCSIFSVCLSVHFLMVRCMRLSIFMSTIISSARDSQQWKEKLLHCTFFVYFNVSDVSLLRCACCCHCSCSCFEAFEVLVARSSIALQIVF